MAFDAERRLRLARAGLYLCYALVGAAWAASYATSNSPMAFEAVGLYDRMAGIQAAPGLGRLLALPWWLPETGSIAVYLWAAPFLAVLGPNLLALQLAKVAWNLAGLRLLEKSFDDPRTGLLATALVAFGCPVVTTIQLSVSGSHPNLLLPLGLLLWLARVVRSERVAASRTRTIAAGAGFAAAVLLMPYLWLGAALIAGGVVLTVPPGERRRLVLRCAAGAAVAGALLLVVLRHQLVLPAEHFVPSVRAIRELVWLIAVDFADFAGSPSTALLGYALEVALAWALVAVARRALKEPDRRLLAPLACALLVPFWICSSTHYQPDDLLPDVMRFRHLAIAWPFLASLLALALADALKAPVRKRPFSRAAAAIVALALVHGLLRTAGAVDASAIGITRRVPLATRFGSLMGGVIPKGETLQSIDDMQAMKATPPELRPTLAFYLPEGFLWAAYRQAPLAAAVEQSRALGSQAEHDAYLEGLGFFACDGTLRGAASAVAELPTLDRVASEPEFALVRGGCELGRRRAAGTAIFDEIDWPLDKHELRRGRKAPWRPLFDHKRVSDGERPEWPWQ